MDIHIDIQNNNEYDEEEQSNTSSDPNDSNYDIKECHICWEENDIYLKPIAYIACCPHISYHQSCLRTWLSINRSCPFCRTEIKIQLKPSIFYCDVASSPLPASSSHDISSISSNTMEVNTLDMVAHNNLSITTNTQHTTPNNTISPRRRYQEMSRHIFEYIACIISVNISISCIFYIIHTYAIK